MTFHAIVYRRFEPQLWIRLHGEYARSRDAGIAEEPVKDSLEGGEEGASSVAEAYAQVVLMQAAYLAEMSAPQMDFAEALLRLWARKVRVLDAGEAPKLAGPCARGRSGASDRRPSRSPTRSCSPASRCSTSTPWARA